MQEEIYNEILNVRNNKNIIDIFFKTLLVTNRSFDFYTNWSKINENFNKYKIELYILNSLINDEKFDDSLRKILLNYPEILPVIPMLLAIRKMNLLITDNVLMSENKNYFFDFSVRKLNEVEIEEFVNFFIKTGLKDFFLTISQKSIPDFYLGIEVGLDSHARKNRSGKIMEEFILKEIKEIISKKKIHFSVITQKKYIFLKEKYGYNITSALSNRKADFLLVRNDRKIFAIETNFYSDTGSKPQEIVNSYIQRQNELKKLGIEFIWITDGYGWKKQQNQMKFAFERLDYVLNIDFIKKGLLEKIIMSI